MSVDQAWDDFFDIPSQTATVSSALLHTLVISAGIQRVHTSSTSLYTELCDYISEDAMDCGQSALSQRIPRTMMPFPAR